MTTTLRAARGLIALAAAGLVILAAARPVAAQPACVGDCAGDGQVGSADLTHIIMLINMCPCTVGSLPGGAAAGCPAESRACTAADRNGNGCVTAGELTEAIFRFINGCPAAPTATPTAAAPPTFTHTHTPVPAPTDTPVPPTPTFTHTPTVPAPTATFTHTHTPVPVPTDTPTPLPPPPTFTHTPTVAVPTATFTPTLTPTPLAPTVTPTPSPTPTSPPASPVALAAAIVPGGGTGGSCRGTCQGGQSPGAPCGTSAECLRVCVGGRNAGQLCTGAVSDNPQCPGGGTCPNTSCSNQRCVGGPLNGTACTTATQCNGCQQSPPRGSCAIVQNPLFPVIVGLNGVCVNGQGQRFSPPGDITCTTSAECRTCVGGTNNGKTCRPTTATINDCPGGTCSGPGTCTTGSFELQVGTPDPENGEAPVGVPRPSLFLAPAVVPGIGTVCVTAGGNASGVVDCDGGRQNINTLSERDHNTVPGDPGNYGRRCKNGPRDGQPCTSQADCPGDGGPGTAAYCAGLPDDPECDNTTPQPDGSRSRACVEGTRRCNGGPNDGRLCRGFSGSCRQPSTCWSINDQPPFVCKGGPDDGQPCTRETLECPEGACTPCNTGTGDGPHPGICNSPTYVTQSGTFRPGDISLGFPLALAVYGTGCAGGQASGCFGPDGLACTADDVPASPPSPVTVALSTGANQVYVFDAANKSPAQGEAISPETICSGGPCIAEVTGSPAASCPALRAGTLDGILLGGGFPAFDTAAGDIATTFRFLLTRGN